MVTFLRRMELRKPVNAHLELHALAICLAQPKLKLSNDALHSWWHDILSPEDLDESLAKCSLFVEYQVPWIVRFPDKNVQDRRQIPVQQVIPWVRRPILLSCYLASASLLSGTF